MAFPLSSVIEKMIALPIKTQCVSITTQDCSAASDMFEGGLFIDLTCTLFYMWLINLPQTEAFFRKSAVFFS